MAGNAPKAVGPAPGNDPAVVDDALNEQPRRSHLQTISVIIPTHNRPEKLAETLAGLRKQYLPAVDYDIIVVDDGSTPPVQLPDFGAAPRLNLIRLGGGERSAARNAGAAIAQGDVLVFVDDDIAVGPDFLNAHLTAHSGQIDALVVGMVTLPPAAMSTPFGRFRQRLERQDVPTTSGLTHQPNFCTAQNMSVRRAWFGQLGGFDANIVSSEDQDFAMRHTARGGRIMFLTEAAVIHRDGALDVCGYCRRHEWGAEFMIPFCRRYPDWPDNVVRERVNGVPRAADGLRRRWRKRIKAMIALRPLTECLFAACGVLERVAPNSRLLDRMYRLLLGAHILRGYRRGVVRFGPVEN
jgi:glycosyltransferase involved in cell wall biosynthesis